MKKGGLEKEKKETLITIAYWGPVTFVRGKTSLKSIAIFLGVNMNERKSKGGKTPQVLCEFPESSL